MSGTFDAVDLRPHSVYRCYDEAGDLLYVGCARNVRQRMEMHFEPSSQSTASHHIANRVTHVETAEYPTKAEARAAEREAIRTGLPLLNKQHNPRYRKASA